MSSDVCEISEITKQKQLLVLKELNQYFENAQKHWNKFVSTDDDIHILYSLQIMPMRIGLQKNNKKYNYEIMYIDTISEILVYNDQTYYINGYCIWTESYGAEINIESEDKCRMIGDKFGFSDETLEELYMDQLRDDNSRVNSMKDLRIYLRAALDFEESQIKL